MGREVIKIREGSGGEGQLEWKLAFGCIFFFFFFFFSLCNIWMDLSFLHG